MGENISSFIAGLNTFFIGIVIVFAVLVLLIFVIVLLGKVMQKFTEKPVKAEPAPVEEVVKVTEEVKTEVAATVIEDKKQDDLELVAVITAAIAASMGTSSDQLRVRSFRKVQRKSL